jgi:hypothetical protein
MVIIRTDMVSSKVYYLCLCRRFGFTCKKRLRDYIMQKKVENNMACIKVDSILKKDVFIKCNRPEIFVFDKRKNSIMLIEVVITSQQNLRSCRS